LLKMTHQKSETEGAGSAGQRESLRVIGIHD
jgi:hypothetical protein